MALDKSLFPRLKKLFSTSVIARNVGGNQIKVVDTDHIQSYGMLQTNSLVDRFTRIVKAGARMQYNQTMNYQSLRLQLYSDYEAMDTDAIVASVLDIVSHDCTGRSENDEMLSIRSSDDNIQEILYNLFYEVLNVEFNLPAWIRSMCKYGDFYIKMDIAEKFGVYNVTPLSVYDIIREEGQDPANPAYICFRVAPEALAGGSNSLYTKKKYENYEIAHFRYISDPFYFPYGRSYLEPARKIFKQLTMMEDAVLLHRILRAGDKRIYYVNVGNIPPNEVDNYMQKIMNGMRRTPYVDPDTGDYNLKFNVQNVMEDYFIPIRNGDTTTKIDTAPGLQYTGMDDVQYMRDKMLAALKVPKDRLNMTEDINGKSTLAGIGVNFSRTIENIQLIVISELKKIAMVHLYVQGYEDADLVNFSLKLNLPSIIYQQEKINLLLQKVDLAKQLQETNILSTDWIYDHVFEMSQDQYNEQRDLLAEDKKRAFRYAQIENEGNDPEISGESYGTPHDLASLYGQTRYAKPDLPDGYDETKPGRPKDTLSNVGKDDSDFGRDPLGKKGPMEPYHPGKPVQQQAGNGPLKLSELDGKITKQQLKDTLYLIKNKTMFDQIGRTYRGGHKVSMFEKKEIDVESEGLLSESNIRDDQ